MRIYSITVMSVTIIQLKNIDKIFFYTNITEPVYPFAGKTCFRLDAAKGHGLEFINENIPVIECKIINED